MTRKISRNYLGFPCIEKQNNFSFPFVKTVLGASYGKPRLGVDFLDNEKVLSLSLTHRRDIFTILCNRTL